MDKRKNVIGREADMENGVITFTGSGKSCQINVAEITGGVYFDLPTVARCMILHGASQKCGDEAAMSRDPDTGLSANPEARFEAVAAMVEHLQNGGEWARKGSGKLSLNRACLFEAIAEVRGVEATVVEARFRDRPDEVLRSFLTHREIAAAYAKRTVRGDQKQAESLLSELE